ncbi:MAG: hypothetical protein U9P14_03750, partial [Gemmatimonadota bacterium]|nr:hypothetical protein [Gemmatimonadota bacterium]
TRIWPLDLCPGNRFGTPGADGSFRVSPNTAQHFWLTVNVPPDAPAGNYAGNLWLRTYRGTCSIPIYFTVLPIALADDPLLPHGVLMSGPQDRAACRDLSLHGVNATSQWYRPAWMPVRYTRGSFSFDYQLQDAFMNRLASEGITGPHIIFAGSARDAVLDRALTKASGIGLDDPSFAPAYAQAVQSIFSHGRKSGWNRTVWGILDRCLPDSAALDFFTVRAQAVKKLAGGTVSLIGPLIQRQEREQAQEQGEVEGERVERLFPCVDIWFTGGMNGQMRQVSPGGVRTWGYAACTQRNSAFESRYQVGFGPWHRRLDGVFIWAYNWTGGGHSWNDFDGPVMDWMLSYRDLDDRYLPTPAWEGFREGVDDRRYILTMEMLLSSIHPADSLARESRLALESLRQVLEGHGIDSLHVAMPAESPVSTDNSPMGLARSLIAGHIIRLTRLFPPQDLDQNRR